MDILNFGSLNIDYVYKVDNFLLPGETKSSLDFNKHCGGKGLNQSIAAAKAGNRVYHAGFLGSDGAMLKNALEENEVDLTYLKSIDETSGHAIIQVDDKGQNCILLYGGTNLMLTKEYIDDVLQNFTNETIILLQNETNLIGYVIDEAYKKGLKIALNAAPMNEKVLSYPIDKLTWLIVNEVEGKQIAKCDTDDEILDTLIKKYPNLNILLTLGSKGACCYSEGKTYVINSYKVNVVDTTAAGDTFTGFFLYGINNGVSIPDSLILATTASAMCVGKSGAAISIPTKIEVDEAIKSNTFGKLNIKEY